MTNARLDGLSEGDYRRFCELVQTHSGIALSEARRPELERAVAQSVGELGLPDADALYRLLAGDPQRGTLLETLIARLTVGETYFFRNRPQFDALEQRVLPELIARRRATRTLRVWSAGCATGEEAYSLAILLQRLLPDLAEWHIALLATDVNRGALERARRGVYGNWSFRDGAETLQPLYFTRQERLFELAPQIRRMVRFEYLNLVDDVYPSLLSGTAQLDLILCRNVLIYFSDAATRLVVGRLYQALAEGGWLFVGHAEPSALTFQAFATRNFPGTVVYQKLTSAPSEPAPPAFNTPSDVAYAMPSVAPSYMTAPAPMPELMPKPSPPPASSPDVDAQALWKAGRADEALTLLRAQADAKHTDAYAPYWLAKIYANRLQLAEAEEWIEVALQRAPLMAEAHYLRGLILQEGGRSWEALEAWRGCVYAEPRFVLAHFALAGQFAKLGQPQRARKALENVEQLLAGRARDEVLAESDGLTVGRLLELAAVQRQLSDERR